MGRDTVLVALAQAAARGSAIVSGIIVAHFIGHAAFADYSFLQMTAGLITTVAGMGIGILASRAAATGGIVDEEVHAQRLSTLALLAVGCSTLAVLAALVLPGSWLQIDGWGERAALAAMAWSGVVSGVMVGLMNGMRRFDVVVGSALVGAAFTLAGAGIGSTLGSAAAAIAGLVVAPFAALAHMARALRPEARRYARHPRSSGVAMAAVRDLLLVALPVLLTSLLWTGAMWWCGRRLLLQPQGDREYALYAVGVQWFSAVLFVPGALNTALLPRLFGSTAAPAAATGRLRSLALRGALAAVAAALPAAAGVMALEAVGLLSWAYGFPDGRLALSLPAFLLASVLAAATAVFGNVAVAQSGQGLWLLGTAAWAGLCVSLPAVTSPVTVEATAVALLLAYGVLTAYGSWLALHKRCPT